MNKKINKSINIKPIDGMFFGERKIFDYNDHNWINSRNVPYPSTVYGAIFAILYSENEKIKREVQNSTSNLETILMENLEVDGIYICKNEEDIIKVPEDVYTDKKCKSTFYGDFKEKSILEDLNEIEYLLFPPETNKMFIDVDNLYMKRDHVYRYKNKDDIKFIKQEDIFQKREKIGIKLNEHGIAQDGMLYRINYAYFKNEDFYFKVYFRVNEDIKLPKNGFMKLGGEGKGATYEIKDEMVKEKIKLQKGIYKVVLTTPGIFINNDRSNSNTWKPYFGEDINVQAAVIKKREYIGGFDQKNNIERRVQIGIPEGSVFRINIYKDIEGLEIKNGYQGFKGFNKFIVVKEDLYE